MMRGPKWKTCWWLSSILAACGGSGRDDDQVIEDRLIPYIQFSPMYSAFGGSQSYSLTPFVPPANPMSKDSDPVVASTVTWSVDPKFASLEAFPDIPAAIKITTKAAGRTLVTMKAKTASGFAVSGESLLSISHASDEDWALGDARYNGGPRVDISALPHEPDVTDADAGTHTCGLAIEPRLDLPRDAACTGCHAASIPHTPAQTAGYSDEQLIAIFTQGQKPAGYTFTSESLKRLPQPDCVFAMFHDWLVDEDVKRGLIDKLRSLPPRP